MIPICVVMMMSWLPPVHSQAALTAFATESGRVEESTIHRLQGIADDLRVRLDIREDVRVALVERNPLVMSVETLARSGPFVIRVDRDFVRTLTEEELVAAIAHEMGHVWIYTHHPYLQSERLANDIAMRVVSREMLEPVYQKVWKRTGTMGNLVEFIGEPVLVKSGQQ
jgi:hypothetical protein